MKKSSLIKLKEQDIPPTHFNIEMNGETILVSKSNVETWEDNTDSN